MRIERPNLLAVIATVLMITVASSSVGQEVFSDGFESGDTTAWYESTEFLPNDISNLWGWWDAGTGVSTVGGGLVYQWDDQSGGGRHFYQDSGDYPGLIPIAHGDRPKIEWPKYSQPWLELADYLDPSEDDIEVFVVARSTPDQVLASVVQQSDGGGVGRAWIYFGGGDLASFIGGTPLTGVDTVDVFDVNIFHTSYDQSEQTLDLYKNGTVVNSATSVSGEPCQGNLMLGRSKNGVSFEGYLYEVIIYDRALSPSERSSVVDYLQQKWRTLWPATTTVPDDLEDLWGWWRADEGVIIGINGIAFWEDQSDHDLVLRQSLFDRRPQYVEIARNGLPGILFDEIDDHLENLNDTLDFATEDATIFVVVDTDNENAAVIAGLDGPTGIGRAYFENQPGVGRVFIGGLPAPLTVEGGEVFGPSILTVYYNGLEQVTQYGVDEWIWGVASNVVGESNPDGGIRMGNGKYDLNELDGMIFEVVIYNRALSWSERQQIVNYLNNRWAIF